MRNKGRLRKNKGRNMKNVFLRRYWPRKVLRMRKRRGINIFYRKVEEEQSNKQEEDVSQELLSRQRIEVENMKRKQDILEERRKKTEENTKIELEEKNKIELKN